LPKHACRFNSQFDISLGFAGVLPCKACRQNPKERNAGMQHTVRRPTIILIALILLLFTAAGPCWADLYIKQKQHTGAFQLMGHTQPAKDEINEMWISGRKSRFDSPEGSTIVDMDKKTMILINHMEKTYSEAPLGQMDGMLGGAAGDDSQQAFQAMAAALMKTETKVVDTGEKKKIKNWNCRKYQVNMNMAMAQVVSEVWATEDIKIDPELFFAMQNAIAASQPGMAQTTEEMKKIKGFQVLSTTTTQTMGSTVQSSAEVLEVVTKSAPANIFTIPSGYNKE
jgi:uncharacterized protein YcbK (DUF882 family)